MHPVQYQATQERDQAVLAVSIKEASRLSNLGRSTIYRRVSDGTLATVKVGGRRLVPMTALGALLKVEAA